MLLDLGRLVVYYQEMLKGDRNANPTSSTMETKLRYRRPTSVIIRGSGDDGKDLGEGSGTSEEARLDRESKEVQKQVDRGV